MKPKLTLDVDNVAVTSFATGDANAEVRGTVGAQAKGPCLTPINSCLYTEYRDCPTYTCPSYPGGDCS
jgi:hypothetical protein